MTSSEAKLLAEVESDNKLFVKGCGVGEDTTAENTRPLLSTVWQVKHRDAGREKHGLPLGKTQ